MYISSAKFENYKSLGKRNNILQIEKDITILIGKNESGKSNVLEALGRIELLSPVEKSYFNDRTIGQAEDVSVDISLSFSEEEKVSFSNNNNTNFHIEGFLKTTFTGGLTDVIKKDKKIKENIKQLNELTTKKMNSFSSENIVYIKSIINSLNFIATTMFFDYRNKLNRLKEIIDGDNSTMLIDEIISSISNYYHTIPFIYYREVQKPLNYSYLYDEIYDIIARKKNDIFCRFFKAAEVPESVLLKAISKSNEKEQFLAQTEIREKLKSLTSKFQDFYSQEKIEISVEFNDNELKFYITSNDKTIKLSSRSLGLKWYFSLFIDMLSFDIEKRPMVFLLDNPDVYLHVNAQKELLDFFEHLVKSNNQIIFTTNSPFMIEQNYMANVRRIIKSSDGISNIYTGIYSNEESNISKLETLSPFLHAIGMKLNYSFGPTRNNINIIVEGMSDQVYLSAMLKYLKIDLENQPHIIPSTGASNVSHIVSILIGWGYEYKALLDYDESGYKEYIDIKTHLGGKINKDVFFVNCKKPTHLSDVTKGNAMTIESLLHPEDMKKVSGAGGKVATAKNFQTKILNGDLKIKEITKNNFVKLFQAMEII